MPLRVVAAGNRSDMAFLPLCAAGTREPSDWFPGPSCGQALRHPEGTRPVMRVSSPPVFVNHATAANEIRWFYRLSAIGYRLSAIRRGYTAPQKYASAYPSDGLHQYSEWFPMTNASVQNVSVRRHQNSARPSEIRHR